MEPKLQLSVFMLLVQASLASWQHIAVKKGQTVKLRCPITPDPHLTNVEWQNPAREIMFFSSLKGEDDLCCTSDASSASFLKDPRYSLDKLSASEFTVSISDVTFQDAGNYTCFQHGSRTRETTVVLTVYESPKIRVTKDDGRFFIKCSAQATHYPPHIYWKYNQGPHIIADAQTRRQGKTFQAMDTMKILSPNRRVTVKCIVRIPALHLEPLINFIKIGPASTRPTQGSTEVYRTTSRSTPVSHTSTTTDVDVASSANTAGLSTFSTSESVRLTGTTGSSTTEDWRTSSPLLSTSRKNDTITKETSTTGWISVSNTTEDISSNRTEGNRTGDFLDPKTRKGSDGGSALLVFLVTCLIFCLLVVVIFFAIKLRRAHAIWKRENDESDQSEDSSKSKSSQEEKNTHGQRRRGVLNTAFTQYVVEEPTVITSVVNTAAMAQTADSDNNKQTPAKSAIKETEL